MSSEEIVFQIIELKYARLRNWQRAIEEKIRKQEIETGQTWDGRPIPKEQLEMLKSGMASVHWGYCTKPYSYEFSPQHRNASELSEELQYVYGQQIYVRVTNNVTGDTVDLDDAFSEWDKPIGKPPPFSIALANLVLSKWEFVKMLRHLRFRIFGPPKQNGLIELGGIPAGSDID
jgi:hypothetical protein